MLSFQPKSIARNPYLSIFALHFINRLRKNRGPRKNFYLLATIAARESRAGVAGGSRGRESREGVEGVVDGSRGW